MIFASAVVCFGVLIGRGYSVQDTYELKPSSSDALLLVAKKDQFSFVADLVDYSTTGKIRLFVHDVKADYTAVSNGTFNGVTGEISLKQVIGYDTSDPLTVSLSCYEK